MMKIFICEDDLVQRKKVEILVNKYIIEEALDMKLTLSADNPTAVLEHLKNSPVVSGLYFLDVDLKNEINGIELAAQIRDIDVSATIVFITTHAEMTPVVFRLKVEAMDYVVKDSPAEEIERRIKECMNLSYERYLNGKYTGEKLFQIKTKDNIVNIPFDDILFFEVEPDRSIDHQIILYTATKKIKFRSSIRRLAKEHGEFFVCHQSIAVNLNKIKEVDRKKLEVTMVNGDIIPVSHRKVAGLLKAWKH